MMAADPENDDRIVRDSSGKIIEAQGIRLWDKVNAAGKVITTINDRMPAEELDGQLRINFIKKYYGKGRKTLRFYSKSGRKLLDRHRLNARIQKSAMSKYKMKLSKKGLNTDMRGLVCAVEGDRLPGDSDSQDAGKQQQDGDEVITMESGAVR